VLKQLIEGRANPNYRSFFYNRYELTASKLGPEQMLFKGNGPETDPERQFFWLRPETVESYFYLWRITKNPKYRDWAWDVVIAIETECRCGSG